MIPQLENNKGCYTVVADSDEGTMRVEDVIQSRKDQLLHKLLKMFVVPPECSQRAAGVDSTVWLL